MIFVGLLKEQTPTHWLCKALKESIGARRRVELISASAVLTLAVKASGENLRGLYTTMSEDAEAF